MQCLSERIVQCLSECVVQWTAQCLSECVVQWTTQCLSECVVQWTTQCLSECVVQCLSECVVQWTTQCLSECVVQCLSECVVQWTTQCLSECGVQFTAQCLCCCCGCSTCCYATDSTPLVQFTSHPLGNTSDQTTIPAFATIGRVVARPVIQNIRPTLPWSGSHSNRPILHLAACTHGDGFCWWFLSSGLISIAFSAVNGQRRTALMTDI